MAKRFMRSSSAPWRILHRFRAFAQPGSSSSPMLPALPWKLPWLPSADAASRHARPGGPDRGGLAETATMVPNRRLGGHHFIKPLMRGTTLLFEGALAMRGFRHRYVATSVGRMHALVARGFGRGPPVVVLGGLSSNIAEYGRALWQLRRAGQFVIGIDLPGHGRSATPHDVSDEHFNTAIRETLQTLCPQPAMLIGHSLGGYFAMQYALTCDESIAKLVLVSPVGAPFTEAERLAHMQLFGVHTDQAAREVAERAWSKSFGSYRMIVAAVRARLGAPIVQSVVHSDIFNASLTPSRLNELRMPVALFWGADDALLPLRQLAYFKTNIQSITTAEVFAGVGHGVLASGRKNIIKPVVGFIQTDHRDARRSLSGGVAMPEQA